MRSRPFSTPEKAGRNQTFGGAPAVFTPYRLLTDMLQIAGEVRGRKKLQKMVFIAQSLGYGFTEPFDLHVWGPYSEVLAVKLKEMTDWGFALEETLPGPAGNHHYVYRPGPNAHRVLDSAPERSPDRERLTALVARLNGQDATLLEGVATVMYLRARDMEPRAVADTLARLKPDKFAEEGRIETAVSFADELAFFRSDG